MTRAKLTFQDKASYAVGDLAANFTWQLTKLLLPYFYTDIFGISAYEAGLVYMIGRFWDAITDPIMGFIADHTKSRWGRFRPWILWGAVPLAVSAVLAFSSPDLDEQGRFIYALVTFLLLSTMYTVVTLPYSTLSAVMTDDMNERSSLAGYRMVFAIMGSFVVSVITEPLVRQFPDEQTGYQAVVIIYSVIATLLFWLSFARSRERVDVGQKKSYGLRDSLQIILKNQPLIMLSSAVFFTGMASTMKFGTGMYFCKYFLGDQALFSTFMACVLGGAAAGIFLSTWLSQRIGKKNMFLIGVTIQSVTDLAIWVLCSNVDVTGMLAPVFALVAVSGIGGGACVQLMWAMAPDTVEYAEWKTGMRGDGITYSAFSFIQKTDTGIGIYLMGLVLTWVGYVQPVNGVMQEQSARALDGMLFMTTLAPVIAGVIGFTFICFYRLDQTLFDRILADLKQRRISANP